MKKTESAEDIYREAKRELDLRHYQKSVNLSLHAIDLTPTNLDMHLLAGKAYSLLGKTDSATVQLVYVIDKNPKYKDAYLLLLNNEIIACNYSQALDYDDMGLKYYPGDRELLLKRLEIFTKQEDWMSATRVADYLFERFSMDPYIRSVYLDFKLTIARQYAHKGYLELAKRAYENVLDQDPLNKEALEAIYSLNIRSGNYESSLAITNRALQLSPNSYEYLKKKIGILESMSRYSEAVEVSDRLLKLYPGQAEARRLNAYLRAEASRYYMRSDPYLSVQSTLDHNPSDRSALMSLINVAYGRGLYPDALMWVNQGLKYYPNDKEFLLKKVGILESEKRFDLAASLAEKVYSLYPTPDNKQNLLELKNLCVRQFISDGEFDSAAVVIRCVLHYDPANLLAINYLTNSFITQKKYDSAVMVLDQALKYYPGDQNLLFKKAGVLEENKKYEEAAVISKDLLERYPDNPKYLGSFVEQSLAASRESMQYEDYSSTISTLTEVLVSQPDNLDALNYMVNIESASKNYGAALQYCDQALHYYPGNRDLLLKKASVYAEAGQYENAYALSGELYRNYPFSTRYRKAYLEHLMAAGTQDMKRGQADSAVLEFYKVIALEPDDTLPLYYIINILLDKQQYDSALALIAHGREVYPSNPYFLFKRAQVYESRKDWKDAALTYDTLTSMLPLDPRVQDYAEYLYSRTLKNEIGFFYLHSTVVDTGNITVYNMGTFQFTHRFEKWSLTGRINYASRVNNTGFQFEAETYYNFRPKWTLFLYGAYSPDSLIFPIVRASASVFHSLPGGWEAELGGRYFQASNGTAYPVVASVGRGNKEWSFNLRGYVTPLVQPGNITNTYYSGILSTRFFLNKHADYLSALAGYGTVPDDFSRNYQLVHLLAYETVSNGIGYSRNFHYRTTLGIFGTWYNVKVADFHRINEYDVYLTVVRKMR